MKILLVSWSTLPNKGGSSIIVENLAQNFKKDELVVLGSKTFFQDNDIGRSADGPVFEYFFSEMYFMGRGYKYFNWFRKWRFRPLINRIKAIIQNQKIEYVIGVYPNPFYCHAACIAARELGIPFSSYFHNTYLENVAITDPKAENIQTEIFDQSEYIFVMSDGMKRFYKEKYKLNKFRSLIHTFNKYPANPPFRGMINDHSSFCKLVAIGNFNESNMDATLRFAAAIHQHKKYKLSLFTHVPKILLRKRGMELSNVEHEGFVDPDQVHEVLQQFDICVLTHGFTGGYGVIEYKTIFPTRMIPLLLSGKPIIAHSPDGSFLNAFIKENKCALLVDQPSKGAILKALDQLSNDPKLQEALVKASKKTAEKFHGPEVVKKWKAILAKNETSYDEVNV